MHERVLPASPNWYCSRSSDTNGKGIFGFGAKNTIFLISVNSSSPVVVGELTGHKERVSGFSFCHHPGLENLCASASDDGTVKIWDIEQKVVLKDHRAHQSTITSLHWSPVDKDLVVSGDERGVAVCYWLNRNDTQTFFPEPRNILCLSCSPHNGNYVALGYKDGMIVVIDVTKKNEVIHRFRGHEDEVHAVSWCPEPNEGTLGSRPEESQDTNNGVVEGQEKGCYLASGSKDQTVRIWSTAKGKGVMTFKLPFLKRRGAGVDPTIKERLWLTVHWPKGRPSHVVSSCFGGELILWDLNKTGKQKWSLLGTSLDGQNHSRIVFNLSALSLEENQEVLISTSMDREIKCWDLSSLECCWTMPTLGGFVYTMAFSPVATGCLALGVGDTMIRVWNTLAIQNKYDTKTFWQGIKSKVTALSWHPTKEGSLAFGTDDGKVGIYEAYSNKPPQISSTYHRKTVYSLAWGPPVPPLSFGATGDGPSLSLYSCAGEGLIFQHNPWKLAGEATDIDQVIRDTNNITHKLPLHSELSWKPDGKVLAVGNEDGSIEVFQAPSLKLLCAIQQHHKIINALRWHPPHDGQPELAHLLASGSSNAVVYVQDLKGVIECPPESPVLITEAFRSLKGHTAKITGLAWSPHHSGRLVTVCYDGTAQVWDALKEEAVCNYRGHRGRVLCVQWSPVDADVVWSGGDDFTVQEWAVSKQEHTTPPRGKKGIELEKKRASLSKAKAKKKKKASGKEVARTELNYSPSEVVEKGAGSPRPEGGPSEEEEEEEEGVGGERAGTPQPAAWVKEPSFQTDRVVPEKAQNGGRAFVSAKRETKDDKKRDKQESSVRKKKARSILPLSTSMDHRPKEDLQQDCLTLAACRRSEPLPGQCVPGSGDHIQLGLFADRPALYRMFREEELSHVEGGHYESAIYLLLWKGDIAGALQLATEKGELTDHLVSIAPMAGYQVWSKTVEDYAKQLCFQEQFLKASSYLLSVNKVYQAVDLLKSHHLFREAIALAKARLQPEDPVLKDLYTTWAAVLERDGHYSTAAKCLLAADSTFDAAKVMAKKGDVNSLATAAGLARIGGEGDLAHSLSLRCAKDLQSNQDWLGAQEALRMQESLWGHRLLLCTNELLVVKLMATDVVNWTCTSTHGWSESSSGSFFAMVTDVWEREFGVSASDLDAIKTVHRHLKTIENPSVTSNVPTKQLLYHLSLDVTRFLLNWLLGNWGPGLEELLGGLTRINEVGNFTLMSEICQLLFPQGPGSVSEYKSKLCPTDEEGSAAARSLEAFLCYLQLYKLWWDASRNEASCLSAEVLCQPNGQGASTAEAVGQGPSVAETERSTKADGRVDFCQMLLSEPHATLQATQRAISEIQTRLSSLVHRHGQLGGTPADPAGVEAPVPAVDEQGIPSGPLPSLIAKVSEHHKELSEIPDYVKKYPFPDVVECCLVVLHVDRNSVSVPELLRKRAQHLIHKYGTAAHHKACQRIGDGQ